MILTGSVADRGPYPDSLWVSLTVYTFGGSIIPTYDAFRPLALTLGAQFFPSEQMPILPSNGTLMISGSGVGENVVLSP